MKSVFVSHSSSDKAVADMIVESLENEGISAWIAPRDIRGGSDYGASIRKGVRECEVLVLVFSKKSNESEAVIREVQLAFNEKKAIIPFRIEDVPVCDGMAFYLSGLQWVDAVQKNKNLDVLLKDVKVILLNLGKEIKESPPVPVYGRTLTAYHPESFVRMKAVLATAFALLLIIAGLFVFMNTTGDTDLAVDIGPHFPLYNSPDQHGTMSVDELSQEEELYLLADDAYPTTIPEVAQVAIGDIIQFGRHDWRVLYVQGNQALVVKDYVVFFRWYHRSPLDVTWERSSMRSWLNGEFFYTRFSPEEQARIAETYVINDNNPWNFSISMGWRNTPGGANTIDRIFLLSIDEVLRYFGDSGLVAEGAAMRCDERVYIEPQFPEWGIYLYGIHDEFSEARIARSIGFDLPV